MTAIFTLYFLSSCADILWLQKQTERLMLDTMARCLLPAISAANFMHRLLLHLKYWTFTHTKVISPIHRLINRRFDIWRSHNSAKCSAISTGREERFEAALCFYLQGRIPELLLLNAETLVSIETSVNLYSWVPCDKRLPISCVVLTAVCDTSDISGFDQLLVCDVAVEWRFYESGIIVDRKFPRFFCFL